MKNITVKLSVILLICALMMIFTACDFGECRHEGGTATCTSKAVCALCGEEYGDVLGHDLVEDAAKAPTCTEQGLTKGEHCTRCDHKVEQTVIAPTGHTEVIDAAVEATCTQKGLTEGKHCSVCDEVLVAQEELPLVAHKYDEGWDAECNVCGAVRTCAHDGEKTTVKGYAPDCTKTGLTDGEKCAICGDVTKNQETIPALGHDMAGATCTAPATCKREGCTYTEGEALGHTYDEGKVTTAPGCETKGVKLFTCTRGCGYSYEADIEPTGHTYVETVVPSTCIAQGYTNHACACGDSYKDNEQPLADHTYEGVVTTEPTCEGTGVKTYTCSLKECGKSYTEVVPATGHKEVEHSGKDATCTEDGHKAYVTCENCDYTTYESIPALGHNGGKATCKDPKVCDTCGEFYGTPDTDNGHNYGEADCDSPATCNLCGKTSGSAIGHEDGNKDHKCDRCEAEQGVHEDTNSDHVCEYGCSVSIGACEDNDFDHTCDYGCAKEYGSHVDENKDHACDYGCKVAIGEHKDGDADQDHNCDYCGKFVEGEKCVDENKNHKCDECFGTMGEHKDRDGDGDHLCDYCNGSVDGEVCDGGTATCTKKAVCSECGKEYGEKLPHSYEQSVANESTRKFAATCTTSAVYYYSCSCGEVNRAENAKTFESGEPLGHKDENYDHVCDNACGIPQGDHTDVETDKDHLCDYGCGKPASEHKYTDVVTLPTCEAGGYTTYTCNCGDSYVDNRVNALGHKDENRDHVCDNGCGVAQGEHADSETDNDHACDYCKAAMGDHSYEAVVTEPTCEAGGYTTYTCACGHSYKGDETEPKGHSFGDWVQTKAPTCTAEGERTATCSACGATKTEAIEKAEHSYEAVVTEPTCTAGGYTTYTCSGCGDSYKDDETEAKGHSFGDSYVCGSCGLDTTEFRLVNGGFENGLDGWKVVGNIGSVSSDTHYWIGDPESAEGFAFGMDGSNMFSGYAPGASEAAVGTLTSSTFKIGGSGFVTFKVGAMKDGNYVYVDVVDAETKQILARYYNGLWADRTNDAKSGCTLIAYKADLSAFAGKEVFFRISDNADSGYGLFFADSFITYYENEPEGFNEATPVGYDVSGTIYDVFNGGFELGEVQGWWNIGEIGVVTNADGYWGDNIPYGKDGTFLFTGVESFGADTMREGNRGTLTSSVFEIGGTGYISFMLGGGGSEFCYVQVIDAVTGEVLARYHQQAQQDAVLIQYVADLSAYIGRTARIQVVDYASSGWGCVSFDSVITYYPEGKALPEGAITANDIFHNVYGVTNGSFESGLDGWHMNIWEAGAHNTLGWVESSEHDAGWYTKNDGRKDGNNLFTFCRPDGTNCENTKGELVSSVFTLKQNTFVSFRFGGAGTREVRIELVRADGTVIATFYNEAPGKVNTEMYAYFYQYSGETADCFFRVVDDSTSNYGCFVVDDFRANLTSAPEGFIAAIQ